MPRRGPAQYSAEERRAVSERAVANARKRHGDENGQLKYERLAILLSKTKDGLTYEEIEEIMGESKRNAQEIMGKLKRKLIGTGYCIDWRREKRSGCARYKIVSTTG